MTHSFTVFSPLNGENIWDRKINCQNSRPKSLDMAREYSTFTGNGIQLKQVPGVLRPLSVFVLKSKSNSKELNKSATILNGITTRPLTWGPNGSKFTDAIADLVDLDLSPTANRENIFISSSGIIDDVINNNVFSKTPKTNPIKAANSSILKIVCANVAGENTLSENRDEPLSPGPIANCSSAFITADLVIKSIPNSKSLSSDRNQRVNETVEDLLNGMINEIVRNEAFLKSQAIFEANDWRLAQDLVMKKQIWKTQTEEKSTSGYFNETSTTQTNQYKNIHENKYNSIPNKDKRVAELRTHRVSAASKSGTSDETTFTNLFNLTTEKPAILDNLKEAKPCLAVSACKAEPSSHLHKNQANSYSNVSQLKQVAERIHQIDADRFGISYANSNAIETGICNEYSSHEDTDSIKDVINLVREEKSASNTDQLLCSPKKSDDLSNESANNLRIDVKNCVEQLLKTLEFESHLLLRCAPKKQIETLTVQPKDGKEDLELLLEGIQETDLLHVSVDAGDDYCSDSENDTDPAKMHYSSISDLFDENSSVSLSSEDLSCDALGATLTVLSCAQSSSDDSVREETFVKEFRNIQNSSNGKDYNDDDASEIDAQNNCTVNEALEEINLSKFQPIPKTSGVSISSLFYKKSSENAVSDWTVQILRHQDLDSGSTSFTSTHETSLTPDTFETTLAQHSAVVSDSQTIPQSMLSIVTNNLQPSTIENNSSIYSHHLLDNVIAPSELAEKKLKPDSPTTTNIIKHVASNNTNLNETRSIDGQSVLLDVAERNISYSKLKQRPTVNKVDLPITDTVRHKQSQKNTPYYQSENKMGHENDANTAPKRPTSLFLRNQSSHSENIRVIGILKQIGSVNLTPAKEDDKLADVYSEATEKVLEEDRSLRRHETFTKSSAPVRYRPKIKLTNLQKQVHVEEKDSNSDDDRGESDGDDVRNDDSSDSCSDTELLFRTTGAPVPGPTCHCFEKRPPSFMAQSRRSRSLPFNIKPDYCDIINFSPLDLPFDDDLRLDPNMTTPTVSHPYPSILNVAENQNKRDSALSRGSVASSGTVVASEEEDYETIEVKEAGGSLHKPPKYSPSTQSPLTLQDAADSSKDFRSFKMERSQSLDRQKRNSHRFAKHTPTPAIHHQSTCGMMLSAPSIAGSQDRSRTNRRNGSQYDFIMSSSQSLASSTSYMGDESDAFRSSSIGSSPLSSPGNSPTLCRKSQSKSRSKKNKL